MFICSLNIQTALMKAHLIIILIARTLILILIRQIRNSVR